MAASHARWSSPDGSGNLSGSPKGRPLGRVGHRTLFSPSLSHFQPQETPGSETLSPRRGRCCQEPAGRGAPAPRRCLSGSRSRRPSGERGSGCPAHGGRAPRTDAPASASVSPHREPDREPRWAVNREVGGTPANSKFNFRKNSSWSQTQREGRAVRAPVCQPFFFFSPFYFFKMSGRQAPFRSIGRELQDAGPGSREFWAPGPGRARPPLPSLGLRWGLTPPGSGGRRRSGRGQHAQVQSPPSKLTPRRPPAPRGPAPLGTRTLPRPGRCALLPRFCPQGPRSLGVRGAHVPHTRRDPKGSLSGSQKTCEKEDQRVKESGRGDRGAQCFCVFSFSTRNKMHAHTDGKFGDGMRGGEEDPVEWSLLSGEPEGGRLSEGGGGGRGPPRQPLRPRQVQPLEREPESPPT